jgi:DhnA family fructose-bisphosphate aldolase class Ia
LIFGPFNGLENLDKIADELRESPANAVLSFPGTFRTAFSKLQNQSWIVNLTASTVGASHTQKVIVGTVEQALRLSADAVAVHVNFTDNDENRMLTTLATVVRESEQFELPVVAIMYPRRTVSGHTDNYDDLRAKDVKAYSRLVSHAARIGVELGADVIKTHYTGDPDSFRAVIDAARYVPIVVAGGPLRDREQALRVAEESISAGAAGISFGRNVYQREDMGAFLKDLALVVDRTNS